MTPLEKIGAVGGIIAAVMAAYNRVVVRRRKNIAERAKADADVLEDLKESAIERAKSATCKICGKPTFKSALHGVCSECWVDGKARGLFP